MKFTLCSPMVWGPVLGGKIGVNESTQKFAQFFICDFPPPLGRKQSTQKFTHVFNLLFHFGLGLFWRWEEIHPDIPPLLHPVGHSDVCAHNG